MSVAVSQDGLGGGGSCRPTDPGQAGGVCGAGDSLRPRGQHFGVAEAGASVTSEGSSAVHRPGALQQRMLSK